MKIMRKTLNATIILLTINFSLYSQEFDETRMDRDLEVAENILATLSSKSSRLGYWGRSVSGTYVKGYGVIFTLPQNFIIGDNYLKISASTIYFDNVRKDNEGEIKEYIFDSLREARIEQLVDLMKTFLVDYGDLIGQLAPSDHIMVTEKGEKLGYAYVGSRISTRVPRSTTRGVLAPTAGSYINFPKTEERKISAEVLKADLSEYRKGNMTRDLMMGKVEVKKEIPSREKEPELELFASILGRLYKSDLSKTYYSPSTPSYERLSNFGVIFKMKVYTTGGRDLYFGPDGYFDSDDKKQSTEKSGNLAKDMYPEFIKELKRNLIEYGRTLRNFSNDEILMVKVTIGDCRKCNIPNNIDITVKGNILSDFDKGKIDLVNAMDQITVKEHNE